MPNQAGTLEILAREIGRALAPLEQRVATENALELFAELGVQFPPELTSLQGVSEALAAGATAARDLGPLITQLSEAIERNDDATQIIDRGKKLLIQIHDLFVAIDKIVEKLDGIAEELKGSPDVLPGITSGQVTEFATNLLVRLLDLLIAEYLETRNPDLMSALALIGLIEREPDPGDPDDPTRPPFTVKKLHLNRLGDLIQRPEQFAATVYDWGTPAFDGTLLLTNLDRFLQEAGFPSQLLEDPGAPPSLEAFVFTLQPDPASTPPGLTVGWHLPIEGGFVLSLPISPEWSLHLTSKGRFAADVTGTITPPAQFALAPPLDTIELAGEISARLSGERPSDPFVLLGQADGSRLEAASIALAFGFAAAWNAGAQRAIGEPLVQAEITGGKAVIDTSHGGGVLAVLTAGLHAEATFDLRATWQPSTGARFEGSSALEIRRPVQLTLGPITVQQIYLSVGLASDGGIPLELSGALRIALGPLDVTLDRIGVEALLTFPPERDGNLGPLNFGIGFKPPNAAGLSIETGTISGGGFLRREAGPPERYAGALALKLTRFAVNAFGLFERTPSGRITLVTVLGIRFFPPYQLGFGFSLTGVGGLIGLNRRADIDALRERLASGTAGNVLFAEDPISNAPTLLGDLRTLFPAADGVFVVGPTFQIEWLKLARFDLGIVVELPGPSKIVLLGTARLEVGEVGRAPLVQIRIDILGVIDFVKELVAFDAVLINSRLLQIFHLSGTAAFRLSTGDRPYVLLTIGGFHPTFNPGPVALPPQKRITLTHDTGGSTRLSLRLEAYLAVTSNTFQVGAALEVKIEAPPFGASGFVSFDALIQFEPFYFTTRLSAGFRVRYRSRTLAGVRFSGTLSGPGPLVLSGSFCIELLFFDLCWSGSFSLGEALAALPQRIVSLVQALAQELNKPENLETTGEDKEVAVAPGRDGPTDRDVPTGDDAPKVLVAPRGQLIWGQKRSPLNVPVERLEGVPLSRPQAVVAVSDAASGAAQDWFSPGTFIDLSESEALNRAAFERLDAGIRLGFGLTSSGFLTHHVAFKTIRLPEEEEIEVEAVLFSPVLLDAIEDRQAPGRVFAAAAIIGVRDEPWTLRGQNGAVLGDGLTQTDAHQRARARDAVATPSLDARETIELGGI